MPGDEHRTHPNPPPQTPIEAPLAAEQPPRRRWWRSKATLAGLATATAVAVGGTTYGYASMYTTVTLSVEGQPREVTVLGDTVEEVLAAEGISVGEHDLVAPAVDEEVSDGSRINVRFGKPLELTVDGDTRTYWVFATEVAAALNELGRTFRGADLSASRSLQIGRDGLELEVVTPKRISFALAGKQPVRREVTALTVRQALRAVGVRPDRHDQTTPSLRAEVRDGDRVVFTDIEVATRRIRQEPVAHGTVEREDSSMTEGETEIVQAGRDGVRDVTYRLVYRNGEVVDRRVLRQRLLRAPVDEVVSVGTAPPAPPPTPSYVIGTTVWDQLAQCESGGNWAINTGNGYYGGLQFSLSTWQAYGGQGLPSENSREEQIRIATLLRDASGGYGAWPACSAALGLPR